MRRPAPLRAAAAARPPAARAAALGACAEDAELRLTTPPAAAPFMQRYVAIGNSITAGYQSDGINDSTQARSYAALLAAAAGVPFRAPWLRKPGCQPPIVDFVAQRRLAPPAGERASPLPQQCYGLADTAFAAAINNVAVPGANSYDPTGQQGTAVSSTALTGLLLGGRTQVERALDLDPTFATVWIGNNDVLSFALAGDTATRAANGNVLTRVTDSATFVVNYNSLVTQLRSRNDSLRGVLIGVVDVTNVPLLVPISVFNPNGGGAGFAAYQPAANAAVRQIFGRPIQFAPNCAGSQAAVAFPALRTIAAGANAALPAGAAFTFVCAGAQATGGVLDDAERAVFARRVAGWNAYIAAKADSIGFAYVDPNPLLAQPRATGQIPPFPNLTVPTRPFGPLISNDGVHPGSPAHTLVARALVDAINAKYRATIDRTRVPELAP
jgi:lysophospholipase L1-like esterase